MGFFKEPQITPWPIEKKEHPSGEKKKPEEITPEEKQVPSSESLEGKSEKEIARECFENPERYRNWILENIAVEPRERFDGGSVYYMWLTKTCPVGCEFCFFQSPEKGGKGPDEEITDEGIERIIQLTKDGKMDKFVVSGGGEPLKSRKKVNALARGINVPNLYVVTSAYWSKGKRATEKVLSELLESTEENPNGTITTVRVSLDQGHFEKLSRGAGFQYIQNIVDWFNQNAADNPRFKLVFHTMDGDETVEQFMAEQQVRERKERKNNHACVTLEGGLTIGIEYTQTFYASPFVNMKSEDERTRNVDTFTTWMNEKRGGNMSHSFHGDGAKGAYFLTLYDGTTIVWGSTAPDSETTIYDDSYDGLMQRNFRDVVTLDILEKGQLHMQDLVAEVNPKASERAVAIGLRDFYVRILLEEDSTRLYASIRSLQEFISEGRITEETIATWPQQFQVMVKMSVEELKEACQSSERTVVHQYLEDPNVSYEKLRALHERVVLGHFDFDSRKMCDIIAKSNIDSELKQRFISSIFPPQSGLESM